MRTRLSISLAATVVCALAAAPAAPPTLTVDPLWPKPLGNHWLLGSVTGVTVDAQDHIWVVHRGYDSFTARTEIGLATNPKTAELSCRQRLAAHKGVEHRGSRGVTDESGHFHQICRSGHPQPYR